MLGRNFLHQLGGGTFRYPLRKVVPANVLLGAKIWTVEKLLQAEDFHFLLRGLFDQSEMLLDHRLLDLGKRVVAAERVTCLDETTTHDARHESTSETGI